MKITKVLLGLAVIALSIIGCKQGPKEVDVAENKIETFKGESKNLALNISGMTCEIGCAKIIESKLSKQDGVLDAKVIFTDSIAKIKYDASKTNKAALMSFVEGIGGDLYKVSETDYKKSCGEGKSCSADCKKACCKEGKSCSKDKKTCSAECKKEGKSCSKDKKTCSADCKKACCKEGKSCSKDKKTCNADCKKECCSKKDKVCSTDCGDDCCVGSKTCKADCTKACCDIKSEKKACSTECKKECCA